MKHQLTEKQARRLGTTTQEVEVELYKDEELLPTQRNRNFQIAKNVYDKFGYHFGVILHLNDGK